MYSVRLPLLVNKAQHIWVLSQNTGSCISSTTRMRLVTLVERTSKTDTEEKKLLNIVIIFVFFAQKKYSCSFIKWRLNMDYLINVLATSLGLQRGGCVAVYAG